MKFGAVPVAEAYGGVAVHSIRQGGLVLKKGTLIGKDEIAEYYYCNFGLNPECRDAIDAAGLRVSGDDPTGEARIIELPDHRFFVATLFLPQQSSTESNPHPLITAFLEAAAGIKQGETSIGTTG